MSVESILKSAHPDELVDALLAAYRDIEQQFTLGKWKYAALDAGHFVEAARRLIENALTSSYTAFGDHLPGFNDGRLQDYARQPGNDSYRKLIPRALFAINAFRNTRGGGHLSEMAANEMDATLVFSTAKWVLAEFVRLASGLRPEETQRMIHDIVERKLDLVWSDGETRRVLDTSLKTREQVLVLLLQNSPMTDLDLQRAIEYSNRHKFRELLWRMHSERLIEYKGAGGQCQLLPPGEHRAEDLAAPEVASDKPAAGSKKKATGKKKAVRKKRASIARRR